MEPIKFEGSNDTVDFYPVGKGKLVPLYIMRTPTGVTSVWKLSNADFQQLMVNSGVIAFHIASQTHPPIALTVPDGGDPDVIRN